VATFGCSTCDFMGGFLGGVSAKWLVIAAVTSQDLELSQSVVQIARKLGARTLSIAEPDLGFDGKCDYFRGRFPPGLIAFSLDWFT